jgi:hypothetical protein
MRRHARVSRAFGHKRSTPPLSTGRAGIEPPSTALRKVLLPRRSALHCAQMEQLPDDLLCRPLRAAHARALGIMRRELEGPLWRRAYHGVHVWAALDTEPYQRIVEAAELLPPDGAIGGWAACHLLGADGLDGQSFTASDLPVPLILPPWRTVRPRPGIEVLRTTVRSQDVIECRGVPITIPVHSTFTHMRLSALEAAVAGADSMLRARLVDEQELRMYVAAHPRVKGAPTARAAVELADGRSRSPQESVLRVVWMVDAGLPRPLVNAPVYSDLGYLLGIPDLLDEESGLVAEYDGSTHREAVQHSNDNAREEELERAGLTVVRVTGVDLAYRRRRVVHRLRTAYQDGVARNRSRDRWSLSATPKWIHHPDRR